MTPTITVPSPCPEIVPGSDYHYLNETFQKLVKLDIADLKYLLVSTPWVHFLQYSDAKDKVVFSSTDFEHACWGNSFMPQEYKDHYYSNLLTDKRLLSNPYGCRVYSGVPDTFENPLTRLVWLAIKDSFRDPNFNQRGAWEKIISAGGVTEDVLLDIFKCVQPATKSRFVEDALYSTTANIPSSFIDYVSSAGNCGEFSSVHIPRALEVLNQLDRGQILGKWKLVGANNLCQHVAGCINDHCTKPQNTPTTTAGDTTDSSGSNVSVREPIPDHFARLAGVSN
jgi:hypothetical protein